MYCKVLKVISQHSRDTFFLDFFDKVNPKLGMILESRDGLKWEIEMLGRPIFLRETGNILKLDTNSEIIWDCTLRPIGRKSNIEIGDKLVLKS